jgi:hypothetical protein
MGHGLAYGLDGLDPMPYQTLMIGAEIVPETLIILIN